MTVILTPAPLTVTERREALLYIMLSHGTHFLKRFLKHQQRRNTPQSLEAAEDIKQELQLAQEWLQELKGGQTDELREMDYLTWDAWDSFGRNLETALMSDAQAEGLFPRFDSVVLDDEQILEMLRGIESSCRHLMNDWNNLVQMSEVNALGNSTKELNHAFRDMARSVSGCNFMVYAWLSIHKQKQEVEP